MNILDLTWSTIIKWWAQVAARTGFADRRPRESFEDFTLRVTRKLFVINLVCAILLIAFALVDNLFGHTMMIVFTALTLLSLTLFWVTIAAIPVIAGQTIGTFGGLLPTKDVAIRAYRSLAVWETAVALYVGIASYIGADLSLLWLTVIALVVVIFAGSSVSGTTKLMASLAKLVIVFTMLSAFWNIGRDAFFNQSWVPLVSSPVERDARKETGEFVANELKKQTDAIIIDVNRVEELFEEALLDSQEESDAFQALIARCVSDVNCRRGRRAYADSVLAVKRGSAATPVASTSISTGSVTENPNIVRIRATESIPLLAEWYAIDYADGRYDQALDEQLDLLGIEPEERSRMEALRRKCGFGKMPNGQIQRATVNPGRWSSAFNLQGAVDYKTCGEGDHKYDRKRDLDDSKIDLWGEPGLRTKHWSRWIQYRGLPDEEPYKVYALVVRRR